VSTISKGTPVMYVGKKGPDDWVAHKATAQTVDGNVVSSCSQKRGARRAIAVDETIRPFVRPCAACWAEGEW
jgi:hypothetical protein